MLRAFLERGVEKVETEMAVTLWVLALLTVTVTY